MYSFTVIEAIKAKSISLSMKLQTEVELCCSGQSSRKSDPCPFQLLLPARRCQIDFQQLPSPDLYLGLQFSLSGDCILTPTLALYHDVPDYSQIILDNITSPNLQFNQIRSVAFANQVKFTVSREYLDFFFFFFWLGGLCF